MNKKILFTISLILPKLLLGSTETNITYLKIESASESESLVTEDILSKHTGTTIIRKNSSNNIIAEINDSQEEIEILIDILRNNLGDSIKIEKLPNHKVKIGSQDF